ncbi:uncharacterized protein Z519_08057 [Cladophialophora bantiana CBS 173.52]|uniref:Heterokaryon incompatibility domain-containing protein n=1 Tax=Cladophialophora bantiana (strain ATCC 10958 / CBS 173.52 / CDC B-1940 / NIH 8579) TaxID=1442370 RepID=A0A0D2FXE6_CLAB1|nr:uncharacterized protein Z519_08057 [Cladophialophora bantiana CBS 173.52]KIW91162.1 hypothetical protein Z519_08057 [Cladophialophora bantiana CBS 173.52]
MSGLFDSRWLKRTWTLQELLAPTTVIFQDRKWQRNRDRVEYQQDFGHYKTHTERLSRGWTSQMHWCGAENAMGFLRADYKV